MKYTALVTRHLSMADEALQIKLEDTDSFDTFKERVYTALKVCDYRANVQMRRLFEDTDLTNQLEYNELQSARKSADIMYPLEPLSASLSLGDNSAIEFSKNLSSGEVIKIFLHEVDTYDDLNLAISNVWDVIDSRLNKTNKRELDFISYTKKLAFSTKLKVSRIMEILYGRVLSSTVVEELRGLRNSETEKELSTLTEQIRVQGSQVN